MTDEQEQIASIYAYHDGDYHYRYCGVTIDDPAHHLKWYVNGAKRGATGSPIFDWIRSTANVRVTVLETCSADPKTRYERERYWIEKLMREGYRLVNASWGGYKNGNSGFGRLMPESEVRRAEHAAEALRRPETRQRLSEANKMHRGTDHARRQQSKTTIELWQRSEYRAKHAATWTSERRAKNAEQASANNRGRKHTPEAVANMRAAAAAMPNEVRLERNRKVSEIHTGKPSHGSHVRWHLQRNKFNAKCAFCRDEPEAWRERAEPYVDRTDTPKRWIKTNHIRWHEETGRRADDCPFCVAA